MARQTDIDVLRVVGVFVLVVKMVVTAELADPALHLVAVQTLEADRPVTQPAVRSQSVASCVGVARHEQRLLAGDLGDVDPAALVRGAVVPGADEGVERVLLVLPRDHQLLRVLGAKSVCSNSGVVALNLDDIARVVSKHERKVGLAVLGRVRVDSAIRLEAVADVSHDEHAEVVDYDVDCVVVDGTAKHLGGNLGSGSEINNREDNVIRTTSESSCGAIVKQVNLIAKHTSTLIVITVLFSVAAFPLLV
mmetsp:Transcript_40801/g.46781  ORF Transcript_40801/g.46781 Transcript_40801/m.46781 type:complete len:250 (+) Transcript_40801:1997-2746(+)